MQDGVRSVQQDWMKRVTRRAVLGIGLLAGMAAGSGVAPGWAQSGWAQSGWAQSGWAQSAAAAGPRLLMLGDSLVQGYGLPADEALPVQLQAALHADGRDDVTVINAGVSGDTTAGGVARVDWLLGDNPDAVIVVLGGNDGLRGIDPAETRRNLDILLARLARADLPVLLTGMLAPPNLGRSYGEAFNPIYPELADQHGAVLFPFILLDVATVAALNQADGIHPNGDGVAVIVRNMLPFVKQLLAQVAAKGG